MTSLTSHGAPTDGAWTNNKLRKLSAIMCFAIAIGGAFAEIALAWIWLFPDYVQTYVVPHLGLMGAPVALDFGTRLLGFAVCMIPLSVIFYASHQAFVLFEAFRIGDVFTASAPVRLRRIGLSMLALAVLQPITSTLLGLVLTASNPEGQRILSLGFSINDYLFALFGGLILAIAHVMVEATRMADDHRQII
jgi:Protein of unknown function (DUF2975)